MARPESLTVADEAAAEQALLARRGRPVSLSLDQRRALDAALEQRRGRAPIQPPPGAGALAAAMLKPLLGEETLTLKALQRRWPEIAGEKLALLTAPEKLSHGPDGATLTVRCAGSAAPFVQHQVPLIQERCALAGAPVVRVALVQGPLPRPAPASVRPLSSTLAADVEKRLAGALASVDDPRLKGALMRLGRVLARRGAF